MYVIVLSENNHRECQFKISQLISIYLVFDPTVSCVSVLPTRSRCALHAMSRFAANSDKRVSSDLRKSSSSPQATWRTNVNQSISSSTQIREGARTYVAVSRVTGGETPTCTGHVDVARGSGISLLARINSKGSFTTGQASPQKPVPLSKDIRAEVRRSGFKVNKHGSVELMKEANVKERRELKNQMRAGTSWNPHVEGLGQITDKALQEKKKEYEERRQYIREILDSDGAGGIRLRVNDQGRELYTPKNVASQHSIALGTPSNRRAEYDARRKFLKSNLTEQERGNLAKARGQTRAAAFGLDGTN